MKYLRFFLHLLIGAIFLIIGIIITIVALPFRIVRSLFRAFFRLPEPSYIEREDELKMSLKGSLLKVDCDSFDEEEQKELREGITQKTDFSSYTGGVSHAYELAFVQNPNSCPRCRSETKQYYANFIYATQVAPRAMFAPAGFFCEECPTVVIDHDMINKGVSKEFKFQGVIGIDYDNREEPDLFQTWNGKDSVYIFDEDGNILGLESAPVITDLPEVKQLALDSFGSKQRKNKKRRKITKKSRKQNRGGN